jgi:hypothetical protein
VELDVVDEDTPELLDTLLEVELLDENAAEEEEETDDETEELELALELIDADEDPVALLGDPELTEILPETVCVTVMPEAVETIVL